MIENAYAKINLFLDVIERRDDGFHNLRSVMHSVSLCDELKFEFEKSDDVSIELTSNIPELAGESNLVVRAARLYMERAGVNGKVKIHLENRIPIGAGLGGASSDAAATLRALNRRFERFSEDSMLSLCAEIGSDVAFCYKGGTAVCEGRGEILTPIDFAEKLNFVISIGEERVSTPKAYAALDEKFSNFDGTVEKSNVLNSPIIPFDNKTEDPVRLYNIFEEIAVDEIKSVSKLKNNLLELGAKYTLMTGSGPAVFAIFEDEKTATFAANKVKLDGFFAVCCHSV